MKKVLFLALIIGGLGTHLLFVNSAAAQESDPLADEVIEMSLEELLNVEVTSVSKRAQKISDVAAAVYVITAEDIRRSTATNVPELLRRVPGLHVAQISKGYWAISARGQNGLFANKLLVNIDGRSVYTPLFGGVFWDEQNVMLENVERIEVIRGPGATIWGANAVNGVINIITKDSRETLGGLVSAGGGSEYEAFGKARYGLALGDDAAIRFHGQYEQWDDSAFESGDDSDDRLKSSSAGFRYDNDISSRGTLTVNGGWNWGEGDSRPLFPTFSPPFATEDLQRRSFHGAFASAQYDHRFSETSNASVRTFYSHSDRNDVVLEQEIDTYDIEVQHDFSFYEGSRTIWGLGYRYIEDDSLGTDVVVLNPDSDTYDVLSGFLQHEVKLFDDQLTVTVGSKFEENDFSGFEVQPSVRTVWNVNDSNALWGAFSMASRTPTRTDENVEVQLGFLGQEQQGVPVFGVLRGIDRDDSERLLAYELGYRTQVSDELFFDIATFYHRYDDLQSIEPGMAELGMQQGAPIIVQPFGIRDREGLDTFGIEFLASWRPRDWMALEASYTYLNSSVDPDSDNTDLDPENVERENPEHLATLRTTTTLIESLELDSFWRYVGRVSQYDTDSYIELDLRLAYRIDDSITLAVVGQNLLDSQHEEYESNFIIFAPNQVERGVFGELTFEF